MTKIALSLICFLLLLYSCAHPQRFNSFEEAVANLNTPQLIHEYQRTYFYYATHSEGGGCANSDFYYTLIGCPPDFIFNNHGRGNCGAFTTFAVHCLRQAGYEAYPMYIHSDWPPSFNPGVSPRDYHIVTLYKENADWYILDDGSPKPSGISGPYVEIENKPFVIRIDKEWRWKKLDHEMILDLENYFQTK